MSLYNSRLMIDHVIQAVRDRDTHAPSILNANFQVMDDNVRKDQTVIGAILEMIWGTVVELLYSHVSNLREYPRGCFSPLNRVLNACLGDRPHWWSPQFSVVGTDDGNGVNACYQSRSCSSLEAVGVEQVQYQCVSNQPSRSSLINCRCVYIFCIQWAFSSMNSIDFTLLPRTQ